MIAYLNDKEEYVFASDKDFIDTVRFLKEAYDNNSIDILIPDEELQDGESDLKELNYVMPYPDIMFYKIQNKESKHIYKIYMDWYHKRGYIKMID